MFNYTVVEVAAENLIRHTITFDLDPLSLTLVLNEFPGRREGRRKLYEYALDIHSQNTEELLTIRDFLFEDKRLVWGSKQDYTDDQCLFRATDFEGKQSISIKSCSFPELAVDEEHPQYCSIFLMGEDSDRHAQKGSFYFIKPIELFTACLKDYHDLIAKYVGKRTSCDFSLTEEGLLLPV